MTHAVLEATVGCVLSGVDSVSVRAGDASDDRDDAGGIGSAGRGGLGGAEPIGMAGLRLLAGHGRMGEAAPIGGRGGAEPIGTARHGGLGEAAPIGGPNMTGKCASRALHHVALLDAGLGAGRQGAGLAPLGEGRLGGSAPAGRRDVAGIGIDVPLALPRAAPQVAGLGAGPRGIGAAPPGRGLGAELGAARLGIGAALLGEGLALDGAFVFGDEAGVDLSSLYMWWEAHRQPFFLARSSQEAHLGRRGVCSDTGTGRRWHARGLCRRCDCCRHGSRWR